jgi:hypothetical protein
MSETFNEIYDGHLKRRPHMESNVPIIVEIIRAIHYIDVIRAQMDARSSTKNRTSEI